MSLNYIIFDLEYTDSHWHYKHKNEIIEIGAVKLNLDSIENVSYFQNFVKPNIKISKKIQSITGITNEMVDSKAYFAKQIDRFQRWIGNEKFIFVSWGMSDYKILMDNCMKHNVSDDWIKEFIDVQAVFTKVNNLDNPISLPNALKLYNINTPHEHHRALKDAFNTMLILLKLSEGIDVYKYRNTLCSLQ